MSTIYLNPRLKEKFASFSQYKIITFTAPLGYGKSTLINHFKEHTPHFIGENQWHFKAASSDLNLLKENLIYFLNQRFSALSIQVKENFPHYFLPNETPCLFIIENSHLFNSNEFSSFLKEWLTWLPPRCQIWLSGNSLTLSPQQKLSLGHFWLALTTEDFALTPFEIINYGSTLGISLKEQEGENLYQETKGWFAPLYFLFQSWKDDQQIPSLYPFQQLLFSYLKTLPHFPKEIFFLFSIHEQLPLCALESLFPNENSSTLLKKCEELTFLTISQKEQILELHPLLKKTTFSKEDYFPNYKVQQKLQENLGDWFKNNGQYADAFFIFLQQENKDALFELIKVHERQIFSGKMRQLFHAWYHTLKKEELLEHLETSLTLLFFLMAFQKKEAFKELKKILLPAIEKKESPEKDHLLGEYYFIISLSSFRNLQEMIDQQHLALSYLKNCQKNPRSFSPWSFGGPSLLMLIGTKKISLKNTYQYFLHYLNQHPSFSPQQKKAAALIAKAEFLFLKGKWVALELPLKQGIYLAEKKQDNQLMICGFFLQIRKEILQKNQPDKFQEISPFSLKNLTPLQEQSYQLANSFLQISQKNFQFIPNWLKTGDFSKTELFEPSIPQGFLVHLSYLLASDYTDLILAKKEEIQEILLTSSSLINTIYGEIFLSCAYLKEGFLLEAKKHFYHALKLSIEDEIMAPFVENYQLLQPLFQESNELPVHLRSLIVTKSSVSWKSPWLSNFSLTAAEQEVIQLAQQNLSNRQIAEKMFLAEGTIKQYFNHIYSKLQIKGGGKNKRELLLQRLQENY